MTLPRAYLCDLNYHKSLVDVENEARRSGQGDSHACKVPFLAEHGKHAQDVHHARARLQGSIIIFYFSSFS